MDDRDCFADTSEWFVWVVVIAVLTATVVFYTCEETDSDTDLVSKAYLFTDNLYIWSLCFSIAWGLFMTYFWGRPTLDISADKTTLDASRTYATINV